MFRAFVLIWKTSQHTDSQVAIKGGDLISVSVTAFHHLFCWRELDLKCWCVLILLKINILIFSRSISIDIMMEVAFELQIYSTTLSLLAVIASKVCRKAVSASHKKHCPCWWEDLHHPVPLELLPQIASRWESMGVGGFGFLITFIWHSFTLHSCIT